MNSLSTKNGPQNIVYFAIAYLLIIIVEDDEDDLVLVVYVYGSAGGFFCRA